MTKPNVEELKKKDKNWKRFVDSDLSFLTIEEQEETSQENEQAQ